MLSSYAIYYDNPAGVRSGVIPDFIRLEYGLILNQVGVLTVTLPIKYENKISGDTVLRVMRGVAGAQPKLELNKIWFVRAIDIFLDGTGNYYMTLTAYCSNLLLKRRYVMYAAKSAQADKSTAVPADNLIKAFVRENGGSLSTDVNRIWASFAVEADKSLAPNTIKSAPHKNILTVCQEIAQDSASGGTLLYFDIVDNGAGSLELRTWINYKNDRSNSLILSPDFGNLANCNFRIDYTEEANDIYAGGQGEEADRIIKRASDSSRINLSKYGRIELWIDARQTEDANLVQVEANAALRAARPKQLFSAQIIQTPNSLYGVHYFLGDRVRAKFRSRNFLCNIEAIKVTVEPNSEESEKIEAHIQYIG